VGGPSTAETASATGVPLHLNVRDVDAYWLQRKLSSFYSDATMSQSIEGQVLETLEEAMEGPEDNYDARGLENELFLLLDVASSDLNKVQFIRQVTHDLNPWIIVHCVRLHRCENESSKQQRKELMAATDRGQQVLAQLALVERGTDAADWAKERERRAMVNGGEYNNDDDDDENDESTSGSVAAPTWESKLRTVDLEELSFQEGNRFMASKKIQLPEGTWRAQKKGYEEYHIPAVTFKADPKDKTKMVSIQQDMPWWSRAAFGKITHLNRMQTMCSEVSGKENEKCVLLTFLFLF
jgi:pre-mRNA-splicing helicase BRR2